MKKVPTLPEFAIDLGMTIDKSSDGSVWFARARASDGPILWACHQDVFNRHHESEQYSLNNIAFAYHKGAYHEWNRAFNERKEAEQC